MTQQYLAGELSVLLARLQGAVGGDADGGLCAGEVARLRTTAECAPLCTLANVEVRALQLADGLCWACLARGDPGTFERVACVGAQLREFGVCSGLLPDD
jgi:hypothetical protein